MRKERQTEREKVGKWLEEHVSELRQEWGGDGDGGGDVVVVMGEGWPARHRRCNQKMKGWVFHPCLQY